MKATGLVRRVDDIGRIAIPKEVRKGLRIAEGDPLEVFVDNGMVVFKKYEQPLEKAEINKAIEVLEALRIPVPEELVRAKYEIEE